MAEVICGADPTQGGLNTVHVKKGSINKLYVDAEISGGTQTIGSVKIVDATTAKRANVEADGGKNAIYVRSNSLANTALQTQQQTNLTDINNKLTTATSLQNQQQTNLTDISNKLTTTNTSLSEINVKVTKEVVRKIYVFQKVANPYVFGGDNTRLLMENPSPSNLINGVDFFASDEFSNINSTSVYDMVFVCTEKTDKSITHVVRSIITIGIKRNSGSGTVNFDKINISIGYIDNTGNFTPSYNADATCVFSTESQAYVDLCLQDFVGITNDYSLVDKRFAVRVKIFAHVDATTTHGQLGLYHTRGSADSYVEIQLI